MKLKSINSIFAGLVMSVTCLVNVANAGLLKSTTGTNVTQRTCPSVNSDFAGYKEKWGQEIVDYYASYLPGNPTNNAEITPEAACIFNTQWQKYWDSSEAGTKTSLQSVQDNVNRSYLENSDGDIWLEAVLDNTTLSLPEAHFIINSQKSERNSANLFSAQSFLWEGDTTTLEFSALFDFSMSTGTWGDSLDSFYALSIGASMGMTFDAGQFSPDSWGTELALGEYESAGDSGITNEDVNYRDLSISFEVNNGDHFQLWGLSQAFALNGGWIDSANTMRTQLAIQGKSVEESKQVFSNSLTVEVPEPSALTLFAVGLIGLVTSRFKKKS